jgi:hypothetical protein
MKKTYLFLISVVLTISIKAQLAPPQGINYQAMVYVPYSKQQAGANLVGQVPANTEQVLVKFTLEEGNNGPIIYEETQNKQTDRYGLLNTIIGAGTKTPNSPGDFKSINWGKGDPYLRVSITLTDYNTAINSYQKLWSVPYSLYSDYANKAGNGISGITENGNGSITINKLDGSTITTGPILNNWKLTGNTGTNSTNFIGTTDNQDVVVRTNNIERMRVLDNGNIGIGTNSPSEILHLASSFPILRIDGSGNQGANILLTSSSNSFAFRPMGIFGFDQTSQTEWFFGRPYGPGSNQSDRFVIQRNLTSSHNYFSSAIRDPSGNPTTTLRFFVIRNNGFVGINTDSPDEQLSVNGNASKQGGGSWLTFSDLRIKQDIKPFSEGLSILKKLNPVSFRYNEKSGYKDLNKTFIGFIAQDVEKVAPFMVNTFDDKDGPSGFSDKRQLDESALNKIILNAIKEQQEMIEKQQALIDILIKRIEKLEVK